MNVIAIEELAKVIVTKHHLSPQEAEAFVNAFFKNIRNALATEKLVKVKGLGTLAVAVMKSTEYPGRRCKVMTFSPEVKLSKQINKPFAQFEVVTLADGVTFDDVAEETGDDSLIKAVAKEEIAVDDLPMVESWVMVDLPDTPDLMEESLPTMSDDNHPDETAKEYAEEPEDKEIVSEEKRSQPEEVQETLMTTLEDGEEQDSPDTHRGGWWKWVVGLAVAACLLIGFFLLRPSKDTQQANSNSNANTNSEAVQTVSTETTEPTEQTASTAEESTPQTPEDLYAAENERVKYGAYKIVGVDTIITVTPGMTLQRIATIFLGSQMMMYLSAMNDGNDNPQPGEQYKIPKVKLK